MTLPPPSPPQQPTKRPVSPSPPPSPPLQPTEPPVSRSPPPPPTPTPANPPVNLSSPSSPILPPVESPVSSNTKMANYTIKIMNQSGDTQSYILFQDAPKSQGVPASQVFTNVYQSAPGIQTGHNSHALFKMHKTFFAICGTNPDPLAIDHSVTTASASSVTLSQGDVPGGKVYMTAPNNDPSWDDSRASTTTSPNAFAIQTDTNFTFPNENNIFVGLGAKNPNDDTDVVPTATFMAHPGETYTIWPKITFFVCTGEFDAGTIIDVQAVGQTLEIDFETGLPDRTYIHNSNGLFVQQ